MSASTIVPSTMLALATVMPEGKAPELNLFAAIELLAILEPSIFALLLTSALTIEPSTMFAELT